MGLAAFLSLWEMLPALRLVPATVLPPPSALPAAFWREVVSGIWFSSLRTSLSHYLAGLAIGCFLGVSLGIVTGNVAGGGGDAGLDRAHPSADPGACLGTIRHLWFGIDPAAAIFIITTGVFWISYFAALGAVRAVDRDLIELADAFGFRRADQKLLKVILPAATPGILVGVRTALGQPGWRWWRLRYSACPGLGQRMMQASNLLASDVVVVYMATMAAAYGAIDAIFVAVQSRLLRWKR
ncbi:MAG: ABC transporter permease subunit [Pseudolabrys sp.]